VRNKVIDLQSSVATLRRRKRVLGVAALGGLAAGIALVFLQPPLLTSTTLVLLPTPALAEGSSSSDVDTQVHIALSATVLGRAGQQVVPGLSARSVEKMVDISAPTNQLIQIKAASTKAAEAQTVSQAVADSYVGYVSNTAREATSAALADLNVRRDDLQGKIKQLQNEIDAAVKRQRTEKPNSPEGIKEGQLVAGLRTGQADLSVQLNKIQDMIATGGPVGPSATAGTSVIQQATDPRGLSTLVRMLIWGPFVAVVCTLAAGIALLLTERRDQRLRLRDEIADSVGSPVLAAVPSKPQQSVAGWSTLLETYEATPVESWAFRQLLRGLVTPDQKGELRGGGKVEHPQSLTVLSLSGDEGGLAIGPQLAAFASSLGLATHLATTAGHESAAALWAACAAERVSPLRPDLYVGKLPDEQPIDLTIRSVVLERRHPEFGDAATHAATLLSVAAGTATEEELARVAVAVDDAGRHIDGIVVADPDKTDRTSGRHTMDERTLQLPLPTRLTGVTSSKVTVDDRQRSRS
jgi:capsular polysaccharide biosynthesis protein